MNYSVTVTIDFKKQLKALQKKYPSIKNDFIELVKSLSKNPSQGVALGKDCYKVKWNIIAKNNGKSGGARVIPFVVIEQKNITLLKVFDKSVKDTITDKELIQLLKKVD